MGIKYVMVPRRVVYEAPNAACEGKVYALSLHWDGGKPVVTTLQEIDGQLYPTGGSWYAEDFLAVTGRLAIDYGQGWFLDATWVREAQAAAREALS